MNYNLQPENAHKMYREVGRDYEDKILMPVVEGTIKDVIGKWMYGSFYETEYTIRL